MLDKTLSILQAVAILDALQAKKGSYKLGEISRWSKVSRATCDRHLKRMVEWRLLKQSDGKFNGLPCRLFSITDDGHELISIYRA